MPHIQPLDKHVAELIAAGEVVERPASVVKELVENAVDAGASAVAVSIRRGGMGMIRVSDDGCGIAPEELPTAFLRHATSKLRTAGDLAGIGTLGFRGEALAAIAAVSRTELVSRQRGAASGAVLRLEGGVPGTVEETGAPEGTTITVQDLFFNTPARLKFMRKDSAETAAVAGLMRHLSLSHPEISFRFGKDGVEDLHTPGDGKPASAVYAALGREFAATLIPAEGRGGDIAVSGFITKPLAGRGSRSMQTFFINGRFIKSQLLTAALEEGYKNQLMKGKFPGCVLFLTMPVQLVDVNVHPAKTQVKFARERDVFDAVYHTVLDTLARSGAPIPAPEAERRQNPAFFQTMDAKTYREQSGGTGQRGANGGGVSGVSTYSGTVPRTGEPNRPAWDTELGGTVRLSDSAPLTGQTVVPADDGADEFGDILAPLMAPEGVPTPVPNGARDVVEDETEASGGAVEAEPARPFVPAIPRDPQVLPGQQSLRPAVEEAPWRIAGEVLKTYIVCESGGGDVWLIDKHAAHERVNFDRLKASDEPPMRQTLLTPIAAELNREDGELLLEHLDALEGLGFGCEDFGDGAVLVREVPADLDLEDVSAVLEELAEDLRTGRDGAERRDRMLRTMACKASIKGGWESGAEELRALVDKVQSGEVRYCPHGRPVAVKLSRYEIEKMFKRA